MTPLISVQDLIMVLVIAGLPRFQQAGLNLPSEAALGCMGRCFLQGRQCPPWSSLAPGMVALALTPWGWGITLGGSCGLREGLGRRRGQAVLLQVCLWCCCLNVLLSVIALAQWGSGANFISLVSVVIAGHEGGQGWMGKG